MIQEFRRRSNGADEVHTPTNDVARSPPDHTLTVSIDVLKMVIELLDPGSTVCLALTNRRFYHTILFIGGKHTLKHVFPKPAWPFCYFDFKGQCKVGEIDRLRPGIQKQAGYYAMMIQKLSPRLERTHRICTRDAKWIVKGRRHRGCLQCLKSYKETRDQPSHHETRRLRKWQREADGVGSRKWPSS